MMADLTTTYMGLTLRNPIVVSSSGLTGTLKGVVKCAEAGAGAIVLKSLFEEQIAAETGALGRFADAAAPGEGADYLQSYGMALGPRDYLKLVREAKQAVAVPIIASLNCTSHEHWIDYAVQLAGAGADALELNVALMPTQAHLEGATVEEHYYRILQEVKARVAIPVALKVGPFFSALAHVADRLSHDRAEAPAFTVGWFGPSTTPGKTVWRGADALVLFNRFFPFDIDIERLQPATGSPYSTPAEIHTSLRWISILAGRVGCDLAAATGIHDGRDAVKQLLAGATVVQVCSTLYQNGLGRIGQMLGQIEDWMQAHGFVTLAEFRGRLSQLRSERPASHERLQYVRLLGGD
jgi:dihydroorotate dehydrogenase (fumarate)